MKHRSPSSDSKRFHSSRRHYHRSGPQQNLSWDEWVNGVPAGSKRSVNWLKIILIVVAILALGGIIAGLFIELS